MASFALDEEDGEPDDWRAAPGFESLETLEEALRCPVCGDLFKAPVAVSTCGHTFCSLCIRRNLEFQMRSSRALDNSATCPVCRGPASTSTLCVQHNLRAVVDTFRKLRGGLLRHLKGGGGEKRP